MAIEWHHADGANTHDRSGRSATRTVLRELARVSPDAGELEHHSGSGETNGGQPGLTPLEGESRFAIIDTCALSMAEAVEAINAAVPL